MKTIARTTDLLYTGECNIVLAVMKHETRAVGNTNYLESVCRRARVKISWVVQSGRWFGARSRWLATPLHATVVDCFGMGTPAHCRLSGRSVVAIQSAQMAHRLATSDLQASRRDTEQQVRPAEQNPVIPVFRQPLKTFLFSQSFPGIVL